MESLKNLVKNVDRLPREFRDKLYLMQYRRIQYWIVWQAKKHGILVQYVNPSYSSVSCPRCGRRMEERDIVGLGVHAVMRMIVMLLQL